VVALEGRDCYACCVPESVSHSSSSWGPSCSRWNSSSMTSSSLTILAVLRVCGWQVWGDRVLVDGRADAWLVWSLLDLEMDAMMQFNFYDHAALGRDSSADAENSDVSNLEKLLCSRRRFSHPRSMFRESETLQSPHVPCCNGGRNVIRACPHLLLTFDEVKAELGSNGQGICPLGCNMYPRILTGYGRHDGFWFFSGILRLIVLEDEGVSRAQIQTTLRDLSEPICPHMRTDSPYVQHRLSIVSCHRSHMSIAHRIRSPFDKRYDFTYPFETAKMRIDCVAKNCMTGLKIMRIGNYLEARLIRDVGDFKFASNPKWCAQLEDRSAAEIEKHRQEMQELLENYFPINAIQAQHQRLRALLAG
jgi:hypothetical protein